VTLSRPAVHLFPPISLQPLSFRCFPQRGQRGHVPVVMETAPIEMETQPWNGLLSPSHPFRFLRHRFSSSVPFSLRQHANVFASRSLRRFQIISRSIVLLLITQAVSLSSSSDRPHARNPRPRTPSFPSRLVSLV